jgi:hypothetical protein
MNFRHVVFAFLLFSASASVVHALPSTAILVAEESLTDATAQQVLDAAAPLIGESSASLFSQYQAGTITITDLGPVRGGHRYQVSRGQDIVIELVVGG